MDASFFQSSDGLDQLEGEHGDDLGLDDAISMLVQADTEDLTGLVGEGRYGSFEDMADGSGAHSVQQSVGSLLEPDGARDLSEHPLDSVEALRQEAQLRWLSNREVLWLLNGGDGVLGPGRAVEPEPATFMTPASGSLLFYLKTATKNFRNDGHVWRTRRAKKQLDETHMKLKVDGEFRLMCYYSQTVDGRSFSAPPQPKHTHPTPPPTSRPASSLLLPQPFLLPHPCAAPSIGASHAPQPHASNLHPARRKGLCRRALHDARAKATPQPRR